jgi:hypothetical protein
VQQNNRQRILYVLLGAAILVLLVYAAFKVSNFNSPSKPAVTQQDIAKQLGISKAPSNPSSNAPSSKAPSGSGNSGQASNSSNTQQSSQQPGTLAATGPADILAIFLIAATTGTAAAYIRLFKAANSRS